MAKKARLESMTPAEQEGLYKTLTLDSPLILFGRVVKRWVTQGNKDGRDWSMRQAMLIGADGVAQKIILSEKETSCPAKGELGMIPCVVGYNGQLREARDLGAEF